MFQALSPTIHEANIYFSRADVTDVAPLQLWEVVASNGDSERLFCHNVDMGPC